MYSAGGILARSALAASSAAFFALRSAFSASRASCSRRAASRASLSTAVTNTHTHAHARSGGKGWGGCSGQRSAAQRGKWVYVHVRVRRQCAPPHVPGSTRFHDAGPPSSSRSDTPSSARTSSRSRSHRGSSCLTFPDRAAWRTGAAGGVARGSEDRGCETAHTRCLHGGAKAPECTAALARTVLAEVADRVHEGRDGALAVAGAGAACVRAAAQLGQRVHQAEHAEHSVDVGAAGVQQLAVGALPLRVLVHRVGHAFQRLECPLRRGGAPR